MNWWKLDDGFLCGESFELSRKNIPHKHFIEATDSLEPKNSWLNCFKFNGGFWCDEIYEFSRKNISHKDCIEGSDSLRSKTAVLNWVQVVNYVQWS